MSDANVDRMIQMFTEYISASPNTEQAITKPLWNAIKTNGDKKQYIRDILRGTRRAPGMHDRILSTLITTYATYPAAKKEEVVEGIYNKLIARQDGGKHRHTRKTRRRHTRARKTRHAKTRRHH